MNTNRCRKKLNVVEKPSIFFAIEALSWIPNVFMRKVFGSTAMPRHVRHYERSRRGDPARQRFNQPCVHEGITICWRARVVWRKWRSTGVEGKIEEKPVWVMNANFFRELRLITGVERRKKRGESRGTTSGFRRDANTSVARSPSACLEWDLRLSERLRDREWLWEAERESRKVWLSWNITKIFRISLQLNFTE